MIVSIIVAVSNNGVIGKDNDLLWHLPADMRFFKRKTTGHHVLMGRKNLESIPEKYRPLPNRTNIVITRNESFKTEGCVIRSSVEDGIKFAEENGENELFIIGGGQIYSYCLEKRLIDKVYLTRVAVETEGDTYFKPKSIQDWELSNCAFMPKDEKNAYDMRFETYNL